VANLPAIAAKMKATRLVIYLQVNGKKRVQHIPKVLVPEIRQLVAAGHEYHDAVREVLAANAQLWVLAQQKRWGRDGRRCIARRGLRPRRYL
jgi:hypothetical protein